MSRLPPGSQQQYSDSQNSSSPRGYDNADYGNNYAPLQPAPSPAPTDVDQLNFNNLRITDDPYSQPSRSIGVQPGAFRSSPSLSHRSRSPQPEHYYHPAHRQASLPPQPHHMGQVDARIAQDPRSFQRRSPLPPQAPEQLDPYAGSGNYPAYVDYPPPEFPPPGSYGYEYQQGYQPPNGYYAEEDPYVQASSEYAYYDQGMRPSQDYPAAYAGQAYGPTPYRQYSISSSSGNGGRHGGPSRPDEVAERPNYSPDAIERYRGKVKAAGDPASLLSFVKYLIEASAEAGENEADPKAAQKAKDALIQEALKILKRLATQGMGFGKPAYPEAQFYLANCYGNGSLGLPRDDDKAFNLYMQASKQNHAAATYRTAVCYEIGAGTKKDAHRAVQFYRKAAALGDTAAMYKLGMILLKGHLSQHKNPREAVTWLKRAAQNADASNPHALHEMGLLHEREDIQREIPSVIHDKEFAFEQFKKAADLGYEPSCYKLGLVYEQGLLGQPVNPQRSIYYYSKAAEKNYLEAALALSGWYLTGSEGVLQPSDDEAYLWARKAADMGLAKAEFAIGYYSENGIGTRQDPEEARRWYLRAAAQGYRKAQQRLTEMKHQGTARRMRPERHTRGQGNKDDCVIS